MTIKEFNEIKKSLAKHLQGQELKQKIANIEKLLEAEAKAKRKLKQKGNNYFIKIW